MWEGTPRKEGPHLADWPRIFICMRGFRLLYELTVERHIRHGRRSAFQAVSEKAIVNDRWTSNGQHVLHTTAHKTYAYVSAAPEKKTPQSPFCLNERGTRGRPHRCREECMCNICISFFLAVATGENISRRRFTGKKRTSYRATPFFPSIFIFSRISPFVSYELRRKDCEKYGTKW